MLFTAYTDFVPWREKRTFTEPLRTGGPCNWAFQSNCQWAKPLAFLTVLSTCFKMLMEKEKDLARFSTVRVTRHKVNVQ